MCHKTPIVEEVIIEIPYMAHEECSPAVQKAV